MKLKFPIPVICGKLNWRKGLVIIGVIEICLSLVGSFIYLMLHVNFIPLEKISSKFPKDTKFKPEDVYCIQILTSKQDIAKLKLTTVYALFHTGMILCEVALLLYAFIGVFCVISSFKMKSFNKISCLLALIGEAIGFCMYFSGLIILIIPGHCNIDHRYGTLPNYPLTITNMVLAVLYLMIYKPYICYLMVFQYANSSSSLKDGQTSQDQEPNWDADAHPEIMANETNDVQFDIDQEEWEPVKKHHKKKKKSNEEASKNEDKKRRSSEDHSKHHKDHKNRHSDSKRQSDNKNHSKHEHKKHSKDDSNQDPSSKTPDESKGHHGRGHHHKEKHQEKNEISDQAEIPNEHGHKHHKNQEKEETQGHEHGQHKSKHPKNDEIPDLEPQGKGHHHGKHKQ